MRGQGEGVVLFVAYFTIGVASSLVGESWLATDSVEDIGMLLPVVATGQAMIFVSPIILSWLSRRLANLIEQRINRAARDLAASEVSRNK
jgi:hypothetical protein